MPQGGSGQCLVPEPVWPQKPLRGQALPPPALLSSLQLPSCPGTEVLTQSGWVMANGGGEGSHAGGLGPAPPSVAQPGLPGIAGRKAGPMAQEAPREPQPRAGHIPQILRAGLVVPPGLSQWLPRPSVPLPASGASGLSHQPRPAGGQQWPPPVCSDSPAGEACPWGWGWWAQEARGPLPTTSAPCCPSRWTGCLWLPAPSSLTAPAACRLETRCAAGVSSKAGEHRAGSGLGPTGGVCGEGAPEAASGLPGGQLGFQRWRYGATAGVPPSCPTWPKLLSSHYPAPLPGQAPAASPRCSHPTSAPGTSYGNPPLHSSGPPSYSWSRPKPALWPRGPICLAHPSRALSLSVPHTRVTCSSWAILPALSPPIAWGA